MFAKFSLSCFVATLLLLVLFSEVTMAAPIPNAAPVKKALKQYKLKRGERVGARAAVVDGVAPHPSGLGARSPVPSKRASVPL